MKIKTEHDLKKDVLLIKYQFDKCLSTCINPKNFYTSPELRLQSFLDCQTKTPIESVRLLKKTAYNYENHEIKQKQSLLKLTDTMQNYGWEQFVLCYKMSFPSRLTDSSKFFAQYI